METVFDSSTKEYDDWYDRHPLLYQSEILAINEAIPANKKGIEIGTGTGRFSTPFNITIGVEPSENMAKLAQDRGITVINAFAESLPFHDANFDFVLMVTTVCFLADIPKAFSEANRILKPKGSIVIGLIDRTSNMGREYERTRSGNKYYRGAHFHSTEEVSMFLKEAGFGQFSYWQTITQSDLRKEEIPQAGFGKGSFVVIRAIKEN